MMFADALLTAIALPALIACGYLLHLTLLSRVPSAPRYGDAFPRFDVIVPAHNEESGVASTVRNLLDLDYPRDRFRVIVVADNCTDDTAARAGEAGAVVLVRTDPDLRGKGYALEHAFAWSAEQGRAQSIVVIDADTVVTPNLLRAFAERIMSGATALQADYAVRNAAASWRTQLIAVALGMFHRLRSLGRERIGASCGLRGNGMCFTTALLRENPHRAFSLVEDVEYGIRLGERGHRVHYVAEAHVYGEMVSSAPASRSQRRRWEQGRRAMRRLHAPRLLRLAISRRNVVLFDLAMDLLVPPLSTLAVFIFAGLLLSTALAVLGGKVSVSLVVWSTCAGFVGLYVARGWVLSGTGTGGLVALFRAPWYVLWKLLLGRRTPGSSPDEWVRTTREGARR